MKSLLARALVLALTLPAAVLAQSQATTGVIEGTVRDESGAAIPGATVAFRNTATNFERTAESDADGRFRGLLLPLGPYRVTVTKSGFGTHVREGLELQVGQTINLTVTLKVSALQEEVVVTGEAPVIETTRAEGSDRIDERAIEGLPEQRPQLPRPHAAHARRLDRPGPRRRRADRERPEGDPEQHLRGRRRLQQPVLRRAAGRPAPGLHVQHGRHQGGRGGGRGGQRRVRPLQRRLRQRRHQVRHERHPRHRPPVLQERRALLGAEARGRHLGRQVRLRASSRPASRSAGP